MDTDYTFNKLTDIITELATGEDDIKSRIKKNQSNILALFENDFPKELKQDWKSIQSRLTECKSKGEGTFEATMQLMSKETASKIAYDIVALKGDLEYFIKDKA